MKKIYTTALLAATCFALQAAVQTAPQPAAPQAAERQQQLQASADTAKTWLKLVDGEQYGDSWDNGSEIFRMTISKDEWTRLLNKVRQPLGRVTTRDVIDQRFATDPKGLPAGDYMVLLYNTTFSNKPSAIELVTLRFENGRWKVLTYQVK